MIKENHYNSLKRHISDLLQGLTNHREELPEGVESYISEEFYQEALDTLEKRRRKLEKREVEFLSAQSIAIL